MASQSMTQSVWASNPRCLGSGRNSVRQKRLAKTFHRCTSSIRSGAEPEYSFCKGERFERFAVKTNSRLHLSFSKVVMALAPALIQVKVEQSSVILAPTEHVWPLIRGFGRLGAWLPVLLGQNCVCTLLPGHAESQLGCTRMVQVGDKKLFEQLVGLDDDEMTIKYKLVSHPYNSNPFPGSFVNYTASIRLMHVSVGDSTFISWTGSFLTEPEQAAQMHADLSKVFTTGFQGLSDYVHAQQARAVSFDKVSGQQGMQGLTKRKSIGTLDRSDSSGTETDFMSALASSGLNWSSQ